jgi:hypothetical protein
MKKLTIVIFLFCAATFQVAAQNIIGADKKYYASAVVGWSNSFATFGDKGIASAFGVKSVKKEKKSFGLNFGVLFTNKYSVGLEFIYDEFDCGYNTVNKQYGGGLSLTSGLTGAADRLMLFKTGLRIGRKIISTRRFELNSYLIPTIGYSIYSSLLQDTARPNQDERTLYGQNGVYYFRVPAMQNTGFHFLLKATAEARYKFKNNLSAIFNLSYQQGFRPFVVDSMLIVRNDLPSGFQEQKTFWTRNSGTSLQYHFGIRYDF